MLLDGITRRRATAHRERSTADAERASFIPDVQARNRTLAKDAEAAKWQAQCDVRILQTDYTTVPEVGSLGRVGGIPQGVSLERWPTAFDDGDLDAAPTPMLHLLSIAVADLPHQFPRGVRAIAVFINSAEMNSAAEPHSEDAAVLLINDDDLAGGQATVPSNWVVLPEGLLRHEPARELTHQALGVSPIAALKPRWLQAPEYDESRFVLQFGEDFLHLPDRYDGIFGDTGTLFVFEDTAFWQCL